MMMTFNKTFLVVAIAAVISPQLFAQDTLQKTKVGAKEKAQTSQNINVINADKIDSEMINDVFDTVRYIPGVAVNNTGNRFGDNGFNIRGMEGDAVAITLDGLPQGESLDPVTFSRYGMFSSTRNAIEPESVKSIEIIKGANSVLAGSGALGGAVMYTTKDASDFLPAEGEGFGGNIKAGFDGRNDETLTSLSLANRSGGFESLLIYTLRDGSETFAHDNGANVDGPERGQADPFDGEKDNLLVKLSYNFSDRHQLGVVYEDFSSERQGTPLSRQSASYFDFNTSDDSNRERAGLFYKWQANNSVFDDLEIKVDQQEIYTSGSTAFSYASGGAVYLRNEDRSFNQELTNLTLDLTKAFVIAGLTHDIAYGFTAQSGAVENHLQDIRYQGLTVDSGLRDGYPIIDPSWVPKTETDTSIFYLRDIIELNDQLTLVAGLRYDKTQYSPEVSDTFVDPLGVVEDSKFSAVSYQVSANYELASGHRLLGSISTGFKAPTTQQLYLNTNSSSEYVDAARVEDPITGNVTYQPSGRTEADLDTVTNPNLEAEEGINYELAYQWSGEKGNIKLTAFRSDYTNQILNLSQSRAFDTPITSASLMWWLPQCNAAVVADDCYIVEQITEDSWGVPTNTGKVNISGYEIDAAWYIDANLTVTFAFSHTSGEYGNTAEGNTESNVTGSYQKGDPLESISPDATVIGLNYRSEVWGVSGFARLTDGVDQEETFNAVYYSDSSTVVDLSGWYAITENLTLRANITNLFDEEYLLWQRVRNIREGNGGFFGGVSGDGIDRFTQSGRQLAASITYRF
jgi:hemoglobin/transferrin/lactoferrin receptor protein